MIEGFPVLEDGEIALLRAKRATGHVIDDNFQLAINVSQKVFTVFNDINAALLSAREIVKRNSDIEVCLYGKENVMLHLITADNLESPNQ
ncbi:UNVERIFIED_ORG: hypothetical protein DFS12_11161 [Chitinophaga ginsengisegetis]|nr:hypothetical protein [Chitinophaga ginsengisegetis]MDR6650713.1 hypothetical protein [Chitinophaga ginsengisegetis]MDR6657063.1 hypothetical protein [Chitinophaga ginsengisegetis]